MSEPDGGVYVFPCSSAQERLWFLQQVDASTAYTMPSALRLTGPLDLAAFAGSIADLVRRHECLRTSFVSEAGRPVQVVHPDVEVLPTVVDLIGAGQAELDRLVREELALPFDLRRPPLLRVVVYRLAEREHVVLFAVHHILSDAWSMTVLLREVAQGYAMRTAGMPAELPEPAIQYPDYAVWQRDWLDSDAAHAQLRCWRERLAGAPSTAEFPADRPRPAQQSYRGARHRVQLDTELSRRLRMLADATGTTLFMVLFAGFGVLLHRYTEQTDMVIGTPIANRHRAELEGLIGFLANTLALRVDLTDEPTFRDLLGRVLDVASEAYDNQDLPFDVLVDALHLDRDPARHPLFQVMFVLQNAPLRWPEVAGLRIEQVDLPADTAKFDLLLEVLESGEDLIADFEYATALFTEATVRGFAGHLVEVLEAVIEDPDLAVSLLPLSRPAAAPAAVVEPAAALPSLVAEHAARTPDAPAVRWSDDMLTYRDLDRRATELARQLDRWRGATIAIAHPLGAERVIALLAALRAGAAVLIADPQLPRRWRDRLLAAADARALVGPDGVVALPVEGFIVDSPVLVPVLGTAELSGLIARLRARFGSLSGRVLCADLPAGHPDAAWSACWPLADGGCLALPGAVSDPDVLHVSPSGLSSVTGREGVVLCGSGPVPADLVDEFVQNFDVDLVGVHALDNFSGALTGELLAERCQPGRPSAVQPLGQVIGADHLVVLDRHGRPMPEGAYGRIALARPGAAAESLGLRGRRRPGGRLELAEGAGRRIGWADGMPVDAAVIEAALLSDPDVLDVTVTVDGDPGSARATAWVLGGSRPVDADRLSALAATLLPPVAVPQAVRAVDALPVDRDRVPATPAVLDLAVASWLDPEALAGPVGRLLDAAGLPARLRLAPAGQVLRQLRDAPGPWVTDGAGINVVALRPADLVPFPPAPFPPSMDLAFAAALDRACAEFSTALAAAVSRTAVPWLVLLAGSDVTGARATADAAALGTLRTRLRSLGLPVAELSKGDDLAAGLVRAVLALADVRPAILIADAADVIPGRGPVTDVLQRFLVEQQSSGVRVCVAGAGDDTDLMTALRPHRGGPLAPRHLSWWRLTWPDAGTAVRALLDDLGDGADQAVFLTTSVVSQVQVAAALPELPVLRLPRDPDRAEPFLRRLPAFAASPAVRPARGAVA